MVGYRVNSCKSVNMKKKRTEKDKKDTPTFSESEVSKSVVHAAGSLLPLVSTQCHQFKKKIPLKRKKPLEISKKELL